MATYTPNLNLKKPSTGEKYDVVADLNDSKDKIDKAHSENAYQSTVDNVRAVFMYNIENDLEAISKVKHAGFNTVIVSYSQTAWNRDIQRMTDFINFNYKHGVYTIVEAFQSKLISDTLYVEELAFLSQVVNLDGVIGVYTLDEPVLNGMPIATQIAAYNRVKSITNKNVYISDVPFTDDRLTAFQTYFTPDSSDVYMINGYFQGNEISTVANSIKKAVENLFFTSGITPPKTIIPTFPMYSTSGEISKDMIKAHIDGWKPYCTGGYAVFCFDHIDFASSVNKTLSYEQLSASLPTVYTPIAIPTDKRVKGNLRTDTLQIKNSLPIREIITVTSQIVAGSFTPGQRKTFDIPCVGIEDGSIVIPTCLIEIPIALYVSARKYGTNNIRLYLDNISDGANFLDTFTWFFDVVVR